MFDRLLIHFSAWLDSEMIARSLKYPYGISNVEYWEYWFWATWEECRMNGAEQGG